MKQILEQQQVEITNLNKEISRLKEVVCDLKEEVKGAKQELVAVRVEIVDLKLEAKDLKNTIELRTTELKNGVGVVEGKMNTFSKYGYAINIFLILAVLGAVVALVIKQQ